MNLLIQFTVPWSCSYYGINIQCYLSNKPMLLERSGSIKFCNQYSRQLQHTVGGDHVCFYNITSAVNGQY